MRSNAKKDGMQQTVWVFSVASFLHDLGADMISAIWPLFLTTALGLDMRYVGFIDGLGEAVVSISQAVSGLISDKIGKRKPFVWVGYLCGGVARIGYSMTTAWQFIIPFRVLDRMGKIRGAPRDAILSDISTDYNRGRNFGFLRMMDNAGAVTGIIASMLLVGHITYERMFLIAAVPSMCAALFIALLVKERMPTEGQIFRAMKFSDLNANTRLFMFSSALFSIGAFSYSFLLIFANQSAFAATNIPMLYLAITITAAASSYWLGNLSDRIGRKTVLIGSMVLWVCVSVLMLTNPGKIGIFIALVFYGLHQAALDTVHKAFTAELAPKQYVASTLGAVQMLMGICALPASIIAGWLWFGFGPAAPFIFSILVTALSILLLLKVKERNGRNPLDPYVA